MTTTHSHIRWLHIDNSYSSQSYWNWQKFHDFMQGRGHPAVTKGSPPPLLLPWWVVSRHWLLRMLSQLLFPLPSKFYTHHKAHNATRKKLISEFPQTHTPLAAHIASHLHDRVSSDFVSFDPTDFRSTTVHQAHLFDWNSTHLEPWLRFLVPELPIQMPHGTTESHTPLKRGF